MYFSLTNGLSWYKINNSKTGGEDGEKNKAGEKTS